MYRLRSFMNTTMENMCSELKFLSFNMTLFMRPSTNFRQRIAL